MKCYLAGLKEFKDRKSKERGENLPQITKLQVNNVRFLSKDNKIESGPQHDVMSPIGKRGRFVTPLAEGITESQT